MNSQIVYALVLVLVLVLVAVVAWPKTPAPAPGGGGSPVPAPVPAARPEVFCVDVANYGLNWAAAQAMAQQLGATVATVDQLAAAQAAGAQWCWAGWTQGPAGPQVLYPMQEGAPANCAGPAAGVKTMVAHPDLAALYGVNLYGVKPHLPLCTNQAKAPCVSPFAAPLAGQSFPAKWSQW